MFLNRFPEVLGYIAVPVIALFAGIMTLAGWISGQMDDRRDRRNSKHPVDHH